MMTCMTTNLLECFDPLLHTCFNDLLHPVPSPSLHLLCGTHCLLTLDLLTVLLALNVDLNLNCLHLLTPFMMVQRHCSAPICVLCDPVRYINLLVVVVVTLMPEGQLWPFLRMRNSKLGTKNSRSELDEDVVHLPKLHVEKNKSCTTLLIKWWNNVRRNDLIGNNSWVSIERPKQASSHKEDSLCESVINNVAHRASKTAKRHLCNVMLVAIRFIKV